MLTGKEITEINERHKKVDVDQRFTDKVAHKDRGRLLEHVETLEQEAREIRRLSLELYIASANQAIHRVK